MESVKIYMRGYFQCTPDDFESRMCSVDVESKSLLAKLSEGYQVIGAEALSLNNQSPHTCKDDTQDLNSAAYKYVCDSHEYIDARTTYALTAAYKAGADWEKNH